MVTVYFWWSNIKGVHESSGKALRIMQITTVMVVHSADLVPAHAAAQRQRAASARCPRPSNLHFSEESLGWLNGTFWAQISVVVIIVAFGHSLLAMSGFETLAQVYREIAYPKLKNLRITANIVCIYAVICTGVISLFAGDDHPRCDPRPVLRQPARRPGHEPRRAAAAAARFPRLRRDRRRADSLRRGEHVHHRRQRRPEPGGRRRRPARWFRKPHKQYGTTYRIINMMALLQIATIIASRGDVYLLGEAYAFGVVWSFFMKALGVLVLRFQRHDQEYKIPLNIRIGGHEIPDRTGHHHAGSVPGRHRQSVFEADRDHLRRRLHHRPVRRCSLISERINARKQPEQRSGLEEVQPRSSAADRRRQRSTRAPAACWWRCAIPPHGAPEEGAARRPICAATTSS